MIDIEELGSPPDEASLRAFEAAYGEIPMAYRVFLASCNGGHPTRSCFDYDAGGEATETSVDDFLGFGGEWSDLGEICETYLGRIPEDLFPIATTPGDDLILIGRDDSSRAGRVFCWLHDEEADEGGQGVYPVADTFDAFLNLLREPSDLPPEIA